MRHVQIQTACVKIVFVTIETGCAHQILKAQRSNMILRRQADVTLALVGRVVHGDQQAVAAVLVQSQATKQSHVQLPSQAGVHSSNCQWPSRTTG